MWGRAGRGGAGQGLDGAVRCGAGWHRAVWDGTGRGGAVWGGMGRGGLDWIGLVLRSFQEGHPGVTGHAAHWTRDSDMRTAPHAHDPKAGVTYPPRGSPRSLESIWALTGPPLLQRPRAGAPHTPQVPESVPHTHRRGLGPVSPTCR